MSRLAVCCVLGLFNVIVYPYQNVLLIEGSFTVSVYMYCVLIA